MLVKSPADVTVGEPPAVETVIGRSLPMAIGLNPSIVNALIVTSVAHARLVSARNVNKKRRNFFVIREENLSMQRRMPPRRRAHHLKAETARIPAAVEQPVSRNLKPTRCHRFESVEAVIARGARVPPLSFAL